MYKLILNVCRYPFHLCRVFFPNPIIATNFHKKQVSWNLLFFFSKSGMFSWKLSVCKFSSLRGNASKHFKTQIKFNSSALPIYTRNFLVHTTSYSRKILGDADKSHFWQGSLTLKKKCLEDEPFCLVKLVLKNQKVLDSIRKLKNLNYPCRKNRKRMSSYK